MNEIGIMYWGRRQVTAEVEPTVRRIRVEIRVPVRILKPNEVDWSKELAYRIMVAMRKKFLEEEGYKNIYATQYGYEDVHLDNDNNEFTTMANAVFMIYP